MLLKLNKDLEHSNFLYIIILVKEKEGLTFVSFNFDKLGGFDDWAKWKRVKVGLGGVKHLIYKSTHM